MSAPAQPLLLEVDRLCKWYPVRRGLLRRVSGYLKAVDGVSLQLHAGETLGLVGEREYWLRQGR